ncbi:hypothetical protein CEUSTIGMA_g5515.t1 [Chlamydomonas eustigma]|uniref:4-hydroxybenzoate polyprenyltransferase, mitochondrial n=1 Tax=Chlamydomonas eustigma TaxID=1157962 RepID=A0A250X4R9_9CHLO|nr:hypothetical protein CEUSTIGMA_g5515.t1 [Chlamydomonas eustigma]|eukprot:GAX78073.1 hypothetical protein CEUSTIGMA_g5515.t1 [Chlamydomonas eustigma]
MLPLKCISSSILSLRNLGALGTTLDTIRSSQSTLYGPLFQQIPTACRLHDAREQNGEPSNRKSLLQPLWPYAQLMRLDKPIGTWLLTWPCYWSIALGTAQGQLPDVQLLTLFGAGALLLRGAGCTINDLWDRDLDKQVERTKSRPLASGAVQPSQAIVFLGLQLCLGLGILLQLNQYSQILGASSLLLVGTYPLFKRFTHWPQAYLGLTINWGALMGYAAAHGSCAWDVVLPLYVGGIAWTLVYDTIYAHQDKKDDVRVGIKSTALLFGSNTKTWLLSFTAVSAASWLIAGHTAECSWPYNVSVMVAVGHMLWQIRAVDLENATDCSAKFMSNKWVGASLFLGAVLGRVL